MARASNFYFRYERLIPLLSCVFTLMFSVGEKFAFSPPNYQKVILTQRPIWVIPTRMRCKIVDCLGRLGLARSYLCVDFGLC